MTGDRGTRTEEPATPLALLSLWLIMLAIGVADAWLVTCAKLSPFFSTLVHGTLIALLGANNWALQRDLDEKNRPGDDFLKVEQLQKELITKLSVSNMMLERQNKILAGRVANLEQHRRPKSRSWNPIPYD